MVWDMGSRSHPKWQWDGIDYLSNQDLSLYRQRANYIGYALAILDLVCHFDPIPFGWDGMDPPMIPYRYHPMGPLGWNIPWDIPYLSDHYSKQYDVCS